jgi:hypothetical protein
MKPKCGEGLFTIICSPVSFLITYPSNIFSWPPCRLPYTFTFSLGERPSFLLSGNFALTRIDPDLSVRVKPFSSSWVTVPSIMLTGGNAKFLIGVVPAQPLVIRTTIAIRSKRRIPISYLRFADTPNESVNDAGETRVFCVSDSIRLVRNSVGFLLCRLPTGRTNYPDPFQFNKIGASICLN